MPFQQVSICKLTSFLGSSKRKGRVQHVSDGVQFMSFARFSYPFYNKNFLDTEKLMLIKNIFSLINIWYSCHSKLILLSRRLIFIIKILILRTSRLLFLFFPSGATFSLHSSSFDRWFVMLSSCSSALPSFLQQFCCVLHDNSGSAHFLFEKMKETRKRREKRKSTCLKPGLS